MKIDNFDIIRERLTFEKARKFDSSTGNIETINDTYDRYIVQIMQRAKDQPAGRSILANTSARLLKTYEISSLEYFDAKRDHITGICEANNARAYILPQVRSTYDCLKEMIRLGVDSLENPTVKFQHILRSAMCSMHKSRAKRWILDLDSDNMTEYKKAGPYVAKKVWLPDEVLDFVKAGVSEAGGDPTDAYMVDTPHGHTVVTPPFNLEKASGKCDMIFQGQRKVQTGVRYTGPDESEPLFSALNGWLIKDGMCLLYFNGDKK